MAKMMNAIMFNRNYCQYGCCSSVPLWKPKTRAKSIRVQRAREKVQVRKMVDSDE